MAEETQDGSYRWLALIVVIIGTFMSILDSSIVNIAIPKMMAVFGVSLDDVKWVLTSYTLALGAIIPLTAFLAETFGTKKIYMFALAMFTLGSLLCGFAWSNTSMIIFRVIQALGGGMIMPVGMSIILAIFPPHERGTAMGFWGIASMAAPALGPTLGGYIIEKLDWRLIFNLNVPIGIFGVVFTALVLKESPTKPLKSFDYIGFVTSTVGLVSILYVLGEGASIDWNEIKNPLLMTLGCLSLVIFAVNELTHPNPLLELRTFKIHDFAISQMVTCVTTLAMMGGMYVLPLFLQSIRGYTPLQTGLIMFPSAIASGVMMPISGRIFDRFGAKAVTIVGLTILGIASALLAFISMDTARETIVCLALLRGVGMGLSMMPVNTAGMNAIPPQWTGRATAISNTVRQVMSSVSVTIVTTLIQDKCNESYLRLAEQVNDFNQGVMGIVGQSQKLFMQNGLAATDSHSAALSTVYGMLMRQANIDAMDHAIAVITMAVIPAILLILLLKDKRPPRTEKEVSHVSSSRPVTVGE
jgi:EmrB/QacA subfamily drug resistance transporter